MILILSCSKNQLTYLPNNLSDNLTELYCHINQLIHMSDNLPNTLTKLCFNNDRLTHLHPKYRKIKYSYNKKELFKKGSIKVSRNMLFPLDIASFTLSY